jgi:hypothetical protein
MLSVSLLLTEVQHGSNRDVYDTKSLTLILTQDLPHSMYSKWAGHDWRHEAQP